MLQVYQDQNEEIKFAIFIVNDKICKKAIMYIKDNFGLELEATDDDSEFLELGELLSDTLIISYKHCNEDWVEMAKSINVLIVP